jgi:purine nucleosidase
LGIELIKIIYDGDPGIDDALAILYALKSPKTMPLGITTVAGNVGIEKGTKNALNLVEMAERGRIPVAIGATKPLIREHVQAEEFHGQDGLGNTNLSAPNLKPEQNHATDQIVSSIMANKGEVVLVAVGPLTNLAIAVIKEPSIISHVRKVIIMGGAIRVPGNVTMASEFNMYADPEAAKIVFGSGLPITLVSLDVTMNRRNVLTSSRLKEIEDAETRAGGFIGRIARFYIESCRKHGEEGFMHDPLAVGIAIDEELLTECEHIYVDVETEGRITLGKTQADLRVHPKYPPNLTHCVQINYERFFGDFIDTLKHS